MTLPAKDRPSRPGDIARLIEEQCALQPNFEVLTVVEVRPDGMLRDERRTYAQLLDNGRRLGRWLQANGVAKGDRFALMLQNHVEFVEAMVAASLIGAVFVPVDPRSMGEKLSYMLNFVECSVVIAGAYALPALAASATDLSFLKTIVVVGETSPDFGKIAFSTYRYSGILAEGSEGFCEVPASPKSSMFMMFTSGTTGHPKAVVRSHLSYVKTARGLRALGVEGTDVLYTGLPLCHINAHSTLCAGLAMGLRVVLSHKFTKSRLWDICREYGCTVFTLLGGMIPEIYSVPEQPDDADNPVRLIISSGMPETLWGEYERRFCVKITEVYGSTEAGGVLINLKGEGPRGSMGKPPKGMSAAVLGEDGQPCPPFAPGELCFRPETGEAAPVTYFRNEKASGEKIDGGWFRTGDIAHVDEDGWFFFRHRAGGGVRRNGDFVNTAMVETVLARSPDVLDVYVYGVETSANVAGEKTLVAALVLTAGTDSASVRAWASERLQKNDVPEIWQVLEVIPKTVSEKPIERECIALLEAATLLPSNV